MTKDIRELRDNAEHYFKQGKLEQALSSLSQASDLGCLESTYRLATIYFNESEPDKGVQYLTMLKENGVAIAEVFIGVYNWLIERREDELLQVVNKYKKQVPLAGLLDGFIKQGISYQFDKPQTVHMNQKPSISYTQNAIPDLVGLLIKEILSHNLQPSMVYSQNESVSSYSDIRDNFSINFSQVQPYIPLAIVKYFFSRIAGLPIKHSEPPMLMKYSVGQKFKPHHDYIDEATLKRNQYESTLGQRVKTLLYYLNDDFEGGETYFNSLDITVNPLRGSVLLFDNVSSSGELLEDSLHEGKPIVKGEKWLLSIWYRENPEG